MSISLRNRQHAGQLLAAASQHLAGLADLLVIGLPRGGVAVAVEVARALGAQLDVLIVRKLGVPGQEELAFGAVASNGAMVLNHDVIRAAGLTRATAEGIVERERAEIERRIRLWRPTHPPASVAGRPVMVVDDGLATGATMLAAVGMLRQLQASRIIVAVPVAPPGTAHALAKQVDEVICLDTPDDFYGVGQFYDDFTQLNDADVIALLDEDADADGPPG